MLSGLQAPVQRPSEPAEGFLLGIGVQPCRLQPARVNVLWLKSTRQLTWARRCYLKPPRSAGKSLRDSRASRDGAGFHGCWSVAGQA